MGLQSLVCDLSEVVNEETVGFLRLPAQCPDASDDPNPAIELLTGFDDEAAHEKRTKTPTIFCYDGNI